MKLRTGFVSNSSSASFIITAFDGENQSVQDALLENFKYSVFDADEIIHNLDKEIKDLKKQIEESEKTEDVHGFHKFWIEGYKAQIARKELIKESVKGTDGLVTDELYKKNFSKILNDMGIDYSIKDDTHIFMGSTSMYNDLGDMPEIMFKILTGLKFSGIKCSLTVGDEG